MRKYIFWYHFPSFTPRGKWLIWKLYEKNGVWEPFLGKSEQSQKGLGGTVGIQIRWPEGERKKNGSGCALTNITCGEYNESG